MARTVSERDVVLQGDVRRFQDHVVKDILPTIRRTGSYGVAPAAAPAPVAPFDPMDFFSVPANAIALAARYAERNLLLEGQLAETGQQLAIAHVTIEEQAVTVAAHERLTNAQGDRCITDTAKHLGVGPKALFAYMRNPKAKVRWLIKRSEQSPDVVHQDRLDDADMAYPPELVTVHPHGEEPRGKMVTRTYVRPKGLTKLARLIVEGKDPLLPVPSTCSMS
jgi:phage antirepressor YoqD-like protein